MVYTLLEYYILGHKIWLV